MGGNTVGVLTGADGGGGSLRGATIGQEIVFTGSSSFCVISRNTRIKASTTVASSNAGIGVLTAGGGTIGFFSTFTSLTTGVGIDVGIGVDAGFEIGGGGGNTVSAGGTVSGFFLAATRG